MIRLSRFRWPARTIASSASPMTIPAATTVAARTTKKGLHEGEAVGVRIEKSDESLVLTPEGHVHLLLLQEKTRTNRSSATARSAMQTASVKAKSSAAGTRIADMLPDRACNLLVSIFVPTTRSCRMIRPGNVSHDILHGADARGRDHAAVASRVGAGRGALSGSSVMDRRRDDDHLDRRHAKRPRGSPARGPGRISTSNDGRICHRGRHNCLTTPTGCSPRRSSGQLLRAAFAIAGRYRYDGEFVEALCPERARFLAMLHSVSNLLTEATPRSPHRIPTSPETVAFHIGLAPAINASADKHHLGKITKQGSALLRWVLSQAAPLAARADDDLRRRYFAILHRRGRPKAKVALARKLLVRLYVMLRDRVDYDEFCRRGRARHQSRRATTVM
jgi:Transposase IS116/IS110/IS902 family